MMKEKKQLKWPKWTAMVLVAAILVGSVALVLVEKFAPDQTMISQRIVSVPSRVVSFVMRPLQGVFTWATNGIYGYLESWKLRKTIEIEYNQLRARNEELSYLVQRVEQLEKEVEEYETVWGLAREQYKTMDPILASVTAKETGNWFQKFTIDVGSEHGVKLNMAVVNQDGLIGYIDTVEDYTSTVLTIIDSRAGVAGEIRSTGDQGMIHGTLGVDEEATCRMYYLPVDLVPRPGDIVQTSGIGLPFPRGIAIGEVRESTRSMEQNKHYVVIEPMVDFMHINKVMVLIYDAVQKDVEQGSDGQIDYVPVPLDSPRPTPRLDMEVLTDRDMGAMTPPPRVTRRPASMQDMEGSGSDDEFLDDEFLDDELLEDTFAEDGLLTEDPPEEVSADEEFEALVRSEMGEDE